MAFIVILLFICNSSRCFRVTMKKLKSARARERDRETEREGDINKRVTL